MHRVIAKQRAKREKTNPVCLYCSGKVRKGGES